MIKRLGISIILILVVNVDIVFGQNEAFAGKGLRIPFFNEEGVLSHELQAKEGVYANGDIELAVVEVTYFDPEDSKKVIRKINADEATYDEKEKTISGDGKINYKTMECRVQGRGFLIDLRKAKVDIYHDCIADALVNKLQMKSRKINIDYAKADGDVVLEKLTARGNIEVIRASVTTNFRYGVA